MAAFKIYVYMAPLRCVTEKAILINGHLDIKSAAVKMYVDNLTKTACSRSRSSGRPSLAKAVY